MKNLNKHVGTVLGVAAGVFTAGFLMNALRNNEYVKKAIKGFDA